MAVLGILALALLVFSGCAEVLALEDGDGENTCGAEGAACSLDLNFGETPVPSPEETPDLNAAEPSPEESPEAAEGPEIEILEFSTDKNTYASNEEIKASLVVESSEQVNAVKVNLLGVLVGGTYRVSAEREMDLAMGEKRIEISAMTPYCTSGCGGVHPGEYDVKVEIEKDWEVLAEASLKINLVKG